LVKHGATKKWLDEFCETHQRPDWDETDEERIFKVSAVLRALFAPDDQHPSLDSECHKALHFFKKATDITTLSAPQKFYVVVFFWAETEQLSPARIRDKFRNLINPEYRFSKDKKCAYERVKSGIDRGRRIIASIQ
jgi:hypothetical protein